MSWLDEVKWDKQGLVPVIAYEHLSRTVLTLAWMNAEALQATVDEGRAVYWSRSRDRLWRKGEESGHVQKIIEIRLDCDADAVVIMVEQLGGIACHTGRAHCFYRRLENGEWKVTESPIRDPADIYAKNEKD